MKRITLSPIFKTECFVLKLIDLDNIYYNKKAMLPFSRSISSLPTLGTYAYVFQMFEKKPLNIPPL